MPEKENLYFLALVPPVTLAEKIHQLKKEIAENYRSTYSLKIPEHITVIPPFYCMDEDVSRLTVLLNDFAKIVQPFEVLLRNFGHFNSRVIFIHALSDPITELEQLYCHAKKLFEENLTFLESLKLNDDFISHLTVANRDLKPAYFKQAWEVFKDRPFNESFIAGHLSLLKHEGGIWKEFEEFAFRSKND